jgi:hypothetical protein
MSLLPALPYISRKEVEALHPRLFWSIDALFPPMSFQRLDKSCIGLATILHQRGLYKQKVEKYTVRHKPDSEPEPNRSSNPHPSSVPNQEGLPLKIFKKKQGVLREQGHSSVRALLEKSPEHLLKSRKEPVRPAVAAARQTRRAVPTGTSPAIPFRTLASL